VQKLNERQDAERSRAGASGQLDSYGGLSMPYETREQAITSGDNVEYNGYAHSFGGMEFSSSCSWDLMSASRC